MYLIYKLTTEQFKAICNDLSGLMFYRNEGDHYKVKVGKDCKTSIEILEKVGAKILPNYNEETVKLD